MSPVVPRKNFRVPRHDSLDGRVCAGLVSRLHRAIPTIQQANPELDCDLAWARHASRPQAARNVLTQWCDQGLGLGLYIASEIARAHGGRIDVTSSPDETRFTFRMPLAGTAR